MYATEVAFSQATRNQDVAERARVSFAMSAVSVDGNDVLAVYQAANEAVARARTGGGPSLIECKTYRTRPHAEGMRDGGYRTVEEVDEWKKRDPITTFKSRLVATEQADLDEIIAVDDEVKSIVDDAIEFARSSPFPDPATATDFIFSAQE